MGLQHRFTIQRLVYVSRLEGQSGGTRERRAFQQIDRGAITMSENQTPNTNPQPNQDKDSADLMVELREMGQQLEAALRAAVESDRAKQLQKDIAGGVRELAGQLQSAVKSLQTNPRV